MTSRSKLIQEIQGAGRIVDLRDPDYLPGAVDLEAKARAAAEGRHFNGTEALKSDVAKKFKAKVKIWKSGSHSPNSGREWTTIEFPDLLTKSGMKMRVRIAHDPFRNEYSLTISPYAKRSELTFIPSNEKAKELSTLIAHEWEKATGAKLYTTDIWIPRDDSSKDMYHSPITVHIRAPSEKVPTAKYIKGVKEILDTVKMRF